MSKITLLGSGNVLIKLIPLIFKNNLYDEVLVGYAQDMNLLYATLEKLLKES